jgi:hypothetical protein
MKPSDQYLSPRSERKTQKAQRNFIIQRVCMGERENEGLNNAENEELRSHVICSLNNSRVRESMPRLYQMIEQKLYGERKNTSHTAAIHFTWGGYREASFI